VSPQAAPLTIVYLLWHCGVLGCLGGRFRNKLDVHLPSACAPSSLRPVIVFVHGGAWSWGHKFHYSAFCDTLSRRLQAVVVNINYSVYPIGSVDEMVAEVQRSVRCIFSWFLTRCPSL